MLRLNIKRKDMPAHYICRREMAKLAGISLTKLCLALNKKELNPPSVIAILMCRMDTYDRQEALAFLAQNNLKNMRFPAIPTKRKPTQEFNTIAPPQHTVINNLGIVAFVAKPPLIAPVKPPNPAKPIDQRYLKKQTLKDINEPDDLSFSRINLYRSNDNYNHLNMPNSNTFAPL